VSSGHRAKENGHHVRKARKILCRLAKRRWQKNSQIVQQQTRSTPVRGRTKGAQSPKKEGARESVGDILRARYETPGPRSHQQTVSRWLTQTAGNAKPQDLSAAHVEEVNLTIQRATKSHSSRTNHARALGRVLRYLWENYGAPKLDDHVHKYPGLRPRNITATEDDRAAILAAAPTHLRLFILLCSDLAIRSGTAARLGPDNYDPNRRKLTFTSKYGEKLTLPTTQAVDEMLNMCDLRNPEPFVRQLWHAQPGNHHPHASAKARSQHQTLLAAFGRLKASLGITRPLTPHDLRRTTAVAMYRQTRNLRKVQALLGHRSMQATIWYLDHDLEPVELETLETIKLPYIVRRKDTAA
jgi:integrase